MHEITATIAADIEQISHLCSARLKNRPPLGGPVPATVLRESVGQTITAEGLGSEQVLKLWQQHLETACIAADHPGYLAFIPAAPTKLAAAFDMYVSAASIYGSTWLESAGAVYAENQALRWVADLAGFPANAGGVFVQGGTLGNLSALVAARDHAKRTREQLPQRWAVCLTDETHSSVAHMLRTVMDVEVIRVPGDAQGRLTGAALAATYDGLPASLREGIFAVVATAGTTNLGIVDDLEGIGAECKKHGWWMHVDGAYGGAALAAPSVRALFNGIEQADSFIVDPHKWLFSPFDCCALIYRDPAIGRMAHTQKADYLEVINEDFEWNPGDFAVHLTRRARGLPFWFSLAAHGSAAYSAAIEKTLQTAHAGARLVRDSEHLELLLEPQLSVVIFRRKGWQPKDYAKWSERLLQDQIALVTPTRHRGEVCTRFVVVNPQTTLDDLQRVINSMK